MFFAFVLTGLLAVVTAIRGNQAQVATQVESDFTSSGSMPSFWLWVACIMIFGLIGRITGATGAMRLFIILLLVVYIVSKQGLFAQFAAAFTTANAPAATSTVETGAAVNASANASNVATSPATGSTASAAPAATSPASNVPGFVSSFLKSMGAT